VRVVSLGCMVCGLVGGQEAYAWTRNDPLYDSCPMNRHSEYLYCFCTGLQYVCRFCSCVTASQVYIHV